MKMDKFVRNYLKDAMRMDEAFITLLEQKDLEHITVKEICETAGVTLPIFNRHYETISNLIDEVVEVTNQRFLSYFPQIKEEAIDETEPQERKDLLPITLKYLRPYLHFIKDNRTIYRTAFQDLDDVQAREPYGGYKAHILSPILEQFDIPMADRPHYIAYYIEKIIAIINEWLCQDCADGVERVAERIEKCVQEDENI